MTPRYFPVSGLGRFCRKQSTVLRSRHTSNFLAVHARNSFEICCLEMPPFLSDSAPLLFIHDANKGAPAAGKGTEGTAKAKPQRSSCAKFPRWYYRCVCLRETNFSHHPHHVRRLVALCEPASSRSTSKLDLTSLKRITEKMFGMVLAVKLLDVAGRDSAYILYHFNAPLKHFTSAIF